MLIGPSGLRVPWRLLIALCLFGAFSFLLFAVAFTTPAVRALFPSSNVDKMTPALLLVTDGISALATVLAVLAMARLEKLPFGAYGLPVNEAFGKRFWQGAPFGFGLLTLLMAMIALARSFSSGGWALSLNSALLYGILYWIGFILVAIFEELSYRGYLQITLGSAIGFWPAAVVLAVISGAVHIGLNAGETAFGGVGAGAFGLLCAFTLRRTGSLWFAVGMHTSWDWAETYFYSVPDSGILATGHLFNSSFHGPSWLTGGTVGPEASVFMLFALAIAAALIHFMFPSKRTQP